MLFYGTTDVGRKRKDNQDHFGIKEYSPDLLVAVVCDGMGGHRGGREASHVAVSAFIEDMDSFISSNMNGNGVLDTTAFDIKNALCDAVAHANNSILDLSNSSDELREMGTTLVGTVVYRNTAYTANVGDSRMYCVTTDSITQITHDHSLVQYYVDIGRITQVEAKNSPHRNIITRSVGNKDYSAPDTFITHLNEITSESSLGGCYLLLCSDGLYNLVDEDNIKTTVTTPTDDFLPLFEDLGRRTDALINKANELGGTDNITAVLIAV